MPGFSIWRFTMTARFSTGLRNFLNKQGCIDDALRNGWIEIYTGAQPATADAAATGTLLCTVSNNSGALTHEVLSSGTVTLTGGASGSVNTLTVNSVEVMGAAVNFNTSLTQTAADVASQINRFRSVPDYSATSSGAVVTITALPGTGTVPNTFAVVSGVTTITKTDANLAGGVAAVNGLKFDNSIAGAMGKLTTQTWSGVNVATGTAGWFRQYGSVADASALDSTATVLRVDGAVATSGAEMNLNSTAFTNLATTTLSGWSDTIPAQ
jgi:hypothetical protein